MDWLSQIDVGKFVLFTLVFVRISGLVMTAPIFGTSDVPVQVRALLAFGLALLILPSQWHVPVEDPRNLVYYLVFLGSELAIGLTLGFGVVILFSGIEVAGHTIGQVSGLMIAEIFDPTTGNNTSVFSRLLFLVALALFVCIGGHRTVMAAMLDTFAAIPPGGAIDAGSLSRTLVTLVAQSFLLGLRASAPVLVALVLANIVLGLIGRTLPQLNVLVLGFGINSLLALAMLWLTLGAAVWVFQEQLDPALATLSEALGAARWTAPAG
jgi:flagellar biosynthetic protein FliR